MYERYIQEYIAIANDHISAANRGAGGVWHQKTSADAVKFARDGFWADLALPTGLKPWLTTRYQYEDHSHMLLDFKFRIQEARDHAYNVGYDAIKISNNRSFKIANPGRDTAVHVEDFVGVGLGMAAAYVHIIEHANVHNPTQALRRLKNDLQYFYAAMDEARINDDIDEAKKILANFNQSLGDYLVKVGIVDNIRMAEKALGTARNLTHAMVFGKDIVCTPTKIERGTQVSYSYQISVPRELPKALPIKKFWSQDMSRFEWHKKAVKSHGPWIRLFLAKYRKTLPYCTFPSDQADLPSHRNLADEYHVLTIPVVGKGSVIQVTKSISSAITAPFKLGASRFEKERQAITDAVHEGIFTDQELQMLAQEKCEKAMQYRRRAGVPVVIPILHQTLIDPSLGLHEDQVRMLNDKAHANKALRNKFKTNVYVYDKETKDLCINPDFKYQSNPDRYVPIKFELIESNHCLNQFEPFSYHDKATRKYEKAKSAVLENAKDQLVGMKAIVEHIANPQEMNAFNAAIDFVGKRKHWFFNDTFHKKHKGGLESLCKKLSKSENPDYEKLGTLLHSSVSYREIAYKNVITRGFHRVMGLIGRIPLIGRPIEALFEGFAGLMTVPGMFLNVKQKHIRPVLYEGATLHRLVTALGGMRLGSCKSGFDREGVMKAQVSLFNLYEKEKGFIPSYNDLTKEEYQEILRVFERGSNNDSVGKSDVDIQNALRHQTGVLMRASGSGVVKDGGTKSPVFESQPESVRATHKVASASRKGGEFAKGTFDRISMQTIAEKTFGSVARHISAAENPTQFVI